MTNGLAVFRLIGRLNLENVDELRSIFELESKDRLMILDLKELTIVDRDAIRILVHCEKGHVRLLNCPAYVREWIRQEMNTS